MKKDAISTGMFIAIGFICVAIVIAILVPVVKSVINDAVSSKPDLPSVSFVQPAVIGKTAGIPVIPHSAV